MSNYDIYGGRATPCPACAEKDARADRQTAAYTSVVQDWQAAEARATAADQKRDEADQVLSRLSDILTRTANAIKGPPPPLTAHDWSNLPELATALAARGWPAEQRLRDISVSLSDAGLTGGTIHGGVLELIQQRDESEHANLMNRISLKNAEAKLAAAERREAEKDKRIARLEGWLHDVQSAVSRDERHQRQFDGKWTCSCDICRPVQLFLFALASPSTPSPAGEPT